MSAPNKLLLQIASPIILFLTAIGGHAAPITMTPDPVGDWICVAGHCSASTSTRTANVTLLAGDTGPAATLEFRTSVVGGGPTANSTVSFVFDLDVDVTSVSLTGSSGNFSLGGGPFATPFGVDARMEYNCLDAPCHADMLLELAAIPTSGTIRDNNNQFIDSPGAPSQTLPMTFAVVPIPTAAWLFGSAFGVLGWMRRRAS